MKKVFFDTNVLLDSVLPNRENSEEASVVLSASDNGLIEGCVSFLSVANSAYILKKGRTTYQMKEILKDVLAGIKVLPMNDSQLEAAYDIDAPDFEDVHQYECAKSAGCDIIITSNSKHFKFIKDIEVVTTLDFAAQFTEDSFSKGNK